MSREQATRHYHISNNRFYDGVHGAGLVPVKSGHYAHYKISDLDKLFKNKAPNIPKEIRRDYVQSCDVTKRYHIGMKHFLDETKAAGVTKVRTEGRKDWYKKDELDKLFKKL